MENKKVIKSLNFIFNPDGSDLDVDQYIEDFTDWLESKGLSTVSVTDYLDEDEEMPVNE